MTVWNRATDKTDALVEAGAPRADGPIEPAQGEVVMTMLDDDHGVEAVVFGKYGIADAPALHVEHSGAGGYVSAPVFGRPPAAPAGKLFVVMARRRHRLGSARTSA